MQHSQVRAAGASFHVVTAGSGPPLLLLHGWPEFWLTWEPVMQRLAERFTLIAPDLRGFGQSDKPGGPAQCRAMGGRRLTPRICWHCSTCSTSPASGWLATMWAER